MLWGVCVGCERLDQPWSGRQACGAGRANDERRLCWKGGYVEHFVYVSKVFSLVRPLVLLRHETSLAKLVDSRRSQVLASIHLCSSFEPPLDDIFEMPLEDIFEMPLDDIYEIPLEDIFVAEALFSDIIQPNGVEQLLSRQH